MHKHNGVSFNKFTTYALQDSVIDVFACMKVYSNTIVCALVGILPKEAQVPTEQEALEYGNKIMEQYNVLETGVSLANFTGSPFDMIVAMTPPGLTITEAMDGIFN